MWNFAIILPYPTVYLNKIFSFHDDKIIQALPVPPLITYEKICSAIKTRKQNSAPGLDGFTENFYSSFPSLIPLFCQTFNNFFLRKQLTSTQFLALIKLIPKTPNPNTGNDWRPIALLNTDYKILSSITSSQLKSILNSIISPKQHCGLLNRQSFNNHLNILSAIHYTNDFLQPLAILQIDFYKAFDSISHEFILSTPPNWKCQLLF